MALIIFDMDGLMFETGRLAYRAYLKAATAYDFEMNHSVYYYLTGRTEPDIRKEMAQLYGENASVETWRDAMNGYKQAILNDEKRVYKKKGLLALLSFLKENDYQIALASSSPREKIDYYLTIEDMPDFFDVIVAGNEVSKGKPDPEIFLKACQKAQVKPEEALILEDSQAGIAAAEKAKITSFLIEDVITDLPVREGKFRLKQNPEQIVKRSSHPFQFETLLDVKDFLQENTIFTE